MSVKNDIEEIINDTYMTSKFKNNVFPFVDKHFDSDFGELDQDEKIKLAQKLINYALWDNNSFSNKNKSKKCSLLGQKIYLSLILGPDYKPVFK